MYGVNCIWSDRVWQVLELAENIQGCFSDATANVPAHVLISGC